MDISEGSSAIDVVVPSADASPRAARTLPRHRRSPDASTSESRPCPSPRTRRPGSAGGSAPRPGRVPVDAVPSAGRRAVACPPATRRPSAGDRPRRRGTGAGSVRPRFPRGSTAPSQQLGSDLFTHHRRVVGGPAVLSPAGTHPTDTPRPCTPRTRPASRGAPRSAPGGMPTSASQPPSIAPRSGRSLRRAGPGSRPGARPPSDAPFSCSIRSTNGRRSSSGQSPGPRRSGVVSRRNDTVSWQVYTVGPARPSRPRPRSPRPSVRPASDAP